MFQFPAWTNRAVRAVILILPVLLGYAGWLIYTATAPETTYVGYAPEQPVPFSHRLHTGRLKIDCRYCHTTVETAAHAAVPPTQTCINCHSPADGNGAVALTAVHSKSPKLNAIFKSWANDTPVKWKRVHDLPDFVQFNHSAHVARGVSCVSCHDRIDRMDVVTQKNTLSMKSCLECHRDPKPHIRPLDKVTDMDWIPPTSDVELSELIKGHTKIKANQNCSTCHY